MEYEFWDLKNCIDITYAVTVIDAHYPSDFSFSGERHDFWEAVYVADGTAGITADDRIYSLEKGDIIFHKPMEFHKIRALMDTPLHVYIFSFKASGESLHELENKTLKLSKSHRLDIERIMDTAKKAFDIDGGLIIGIRSAKDARIYSNLMELIMLDLSSKDYIPPKENEESKIFAQAVRLLNDSIFGSVTVDYAAKKCCVSPSKLKRLFHTYTGMGIIAYFTNLKMKKAAELLAKNYSVCEVSDLLSFSSQFYFSRVFKKEFGVSPSEYKKRRNL